MAKISPHRSPAHGGLSLAPKPMLARFEGARPWRARAMPLLGTLVEISAPAASDDELRRWSNVAFDRIAEIHAAMSFHEPNSDLAAIARAAAGDILTVAADTWRTLSLAVELEAASGGLFNSAVAPTLVRRGLLPRPRGAPDPLASSARAALELLAHDRVRIVQSVWIDLGGLAKGVAVDAAVDAMVRAGASAGLVNAGGDLRVFGDKARDIDVRDPRNPQASITVAQIAEGSAATTAGYFLAQYDAENAAPSPTASALVAPPTHTGGRRPTSVTVFAPSCAIADGLTKALALDADGAAPVLRRYGASGLCIDEGGLIHHV